MKPISFHPIHFVWLLLTLLVLSACGQVSSDAPELEPQLLILTVTQAGDSGPGTLRDAISRAISGDTITFANNVSTITLSSELVLDKNLTIRGPEGGSVTVSGNGVTRVFRVASGTTAELRNLNIREGTGAGSVSTTVGGGILNQGTLTVLNSTISGNSAFSNGGGIWNDGMLTVTNSTISGNSASSGNGGGIVSNTSDDPSATSTTIVNSTISGNSAVRGGGIFNFGVLTVMSSTISGNSALTNGGGIFSFTSSDRSTAFTTIVNSTISGNSAVNQGGGVRNANGLTRILWSTVTGNRAASGGGVWSGNDSIVRTDVKGSVIVGNTLADGTTNDVTAGTIINRFNSLGYNLVGAAGSNVNFLLEFNATGDQTNVALAALNLGALAGNGGPTKTHALQSGSIALDAVPTSACTDHTGNTISHDQRGVTRPQGTACDIGAFEKEFIAVTLSVNASGTVSRATGAATVGGSVTCSAPASITLDVTVSQTQKQGKTTVTVTDSESVSVSCDGATPWTATVSAQSGGFKSGSVSVSATEADSNPLNQATQAVSLSWVK